MITPTERQIESASALIKQGKVGAIPTDTLYGLAAHPFMENAIDRIFEIKGRPKEMALPLLLSDIDDMAKYAKDVPPLAWKLAKKFLPGALTIVLYKSSLIPDKVTAGKPTVALRVPDHPVPRLLAKMIDAPITGTSANISGMPGTLTTQEVRDQMGSLLDFIIDFASPLKGTASTIVDLTDSKPKILRDGAITREQILEVCEEH